MKLKLSIATLLLGAATIVSAGGFMGAGTAAAHAASKAAVNSANAGARAGQNAAGIAFRR